MTIETKYNIGDEVWFDINFNPNKGKIVRIECIVYEDKGYAIRYSILYEKAVIKEFENSVFSTKEKLLKSL